MTQAQPGQASFSVLTLLRTLCQGDVVRFGATSLVGTGEVPSELAQGLREARRSPPDADRDFWSVTVKSDIGWYVICSQDCDIVRNPDRDPCLVICPLMQVSEERWNELRRSPGNPREFPYPDDIKIPLANGTKVVADLRYLTSVLKDALPSKAVDTLRPLTPRQKERFANFLARRFRRSAFSDDLNDRVLNPAGSRLRALSKQFDQNSPRSSPLVARLLRATDGWFLAGTDKLVDYKIVLNQRYLKDAGFWDEKNRTYRESELEEAIETLRNELTMRLPGDGGYVCRLEAKIPENVTLAEYVTWSDWVWENAPDLL